MIAFSREASESEDKAPQTVLIIGPQIIAQQTIGNLDTSEANTHASDLIAAKVAREQEELAMLQRALVRCGLISIKQNNEE